VVPRVTAVNPQRAGTHIGVELDGRPWRRIPLEVAVRVGLVTGAELGRPELRALRRELRRAEALDVATKALVHRDRSRTGLQTRLAAARIAPWAAEQALDTLERVGIVDDERFARARAETLAARGSGDALIEEDLLTAGVPETQVGEAIAALEPERERAIRAAARRGQSAATARWLARRGFGQDAIEAALPTLIADES
jgi:regulatory protein